MQATMLTSRVQPGRAFSARSHRCPGRRPASVVRAEQQPKQLLTEVEKPVATEVSSSMDAPVAVPTMPAQPSNAPLAIGAIAAAVVAFAVTRVGGAAPTLASLQETSTPFEVAMINGKPSVVEFYASWCEVCRELVPEEAELKKQYGQNVNFVMLNIENSKWGPEAAEFGVRGIPHFIFFDERGDPQAAAIGRIPKSVLQGNIDALLRKQPLPFGGASGPTSSAPSPGDVMAGPRQAMPRDHA